MEIKLYITIHDTIHTEEAESAESVHRANINKHRLLSHGIRSGRSESHDIAGKSTSMLSNNGEQTYQEDSRSVPSARRVTPSIHAVKRSPVTIVPEEILFPSRWAAYNGSDAADSPVV